MPSFWRENARLRGLGRRPQGCGEGSLNVSPTKRSIFSGRRDRGDFPIAAKKKS
jgi:hypothetical protein